MSDFGSLVFYVFSFLISAILYNFYCKHNRKIFLFVAALIPILIGGLRFNVGTDYSSYYNYYMHGSFVDPGFYLISSIARMFDNCQVMFFIYNALTLLFVFLGIGNMKKECRPIAYLCFLFLFFTTSFNAMRQMLAVSIVFFSYKYAMNKKILSFVILTLIASLFHITAIFGLIIYPLLRIKRRAIKVAASVAVLCVAIGCQGVIGGISELSAFEHFSMYQNYNGSGFSNASFFFELLVLAYLASFYRQIAKKDESFAGYFFVYFVGVILLLTGFYSPFVKRIALYFTISSITLLPVIPFSCKNGKDKMLNQVIIVAFIMSRFIVQSFLLGQADIIPYNCVGLW
ncbi:EpsG family protein [Candidatus Saccharibacteria bacterium]|nr:EpsG family protein [Candidatus Saccharibacteria bacterium]